MSSQIITIICTDCTNHDRYVVTPDDNGYLEGRMRRDEWSIIDGKPYCWECRPDDDDTDDDARMEGYLTNANRREWVEGWMRIPIMERDGVVVQDATDLSHFGPQPEE